MTRAPRSAWLLAGFIAAAGATLLRGSAAHPGEAVVAGLAGAGLALALRWFLAR